ncbi:PREDICTED: uncharacterized protein LOC105990348 [Dipodomys ordii]|uniref:Uncharacterized protein LOC105990348 n=1 Tax=Dipodomys ordii TaxID=10020 RepID=A0A1S3FP79_DIPOR|nr:PREDICTED: uncharacterized protein LOC105990348 [Dipodomys ordii]
MPLDAPTLRKKLSRTCDEGARALLSSLLLYVSECADGPPRPEDRAHGAGRTPPSQEASRRPTRFQLLQAKFMGTGREPYLKRTREVGRLISKDKQGPGRSLVSATINRLMEKTKEGASSPGHRPLPSEKPRWGPPGGKSIVKNIVKKLLAVDEKEKDTGDKPSAQQPGSIRGLLPRIVGRSSILSKLKEKFEQSSCLHSEASVLPLHRAGRKSRSQQRKKVHRPQVRVLHTATMAPSFTRTPPLRFLACTAEPLPALSIATIVCGPQSWQSHCAKISHLDSRRHPQRETSMSSTSGDRTAPLNGEPIGQLESATISEPQADTHSFGLMAPSSECGPPPGSCCISLQGKALPGPVPVLSSSASPGDAAAPAAGNKTQGLASHGQDAGEAPEITMTMCSSEDEADRAPTDAESQPLFAMQWHLPEQEATAWIPPLDPGADQAAQQAQPAIEPAQTTTQLPVVHKMPAPLLLPPRASGHKLKGSYVSGGENVIERIPAALAPGAEDKEGHQYQGTSTPEILGAAKEQGPQGDPREAAHADRDIPQTGLEPAPSESPCGKGTPLGLRNRHSVSGQSAESSWKTHPSTETNETPASLSEASPAHPTPPKSHSRPRAVQLELSSFMLALTQGCTRPEESTTTNKSILCGQEEGRRPVVESILPPRIDEKNISGDLDKDRQSSSDEIPSAGTNASGEAMATGNVTRPTVLQPGGAAEGQFSGDTARPLPLAREAPTAWPGDTAHTSLVPANPQLCAPTQPAASKCSAGADGRNSAMAANALRDNTVSQSPQKRSEGLLSSNRGQPPSVGPPAPSPRGLGLEPHPGLGAPSPSAYALVPVLGVEPLDPGQQALPRAAPKAKSLGPGAQVDQQVPDGSQLRLEEAGAGHQAGQPEGSEKRGAAPLDQRAVLCMTEPQAQAAQDLAGGEKMPTVAKPCPHKAQGQEQALGPCGRRASSPAPGGSPQAGVIPATSRKLKSPGSLAVQGQGQGQGLAGGMAAQAQAQLACTGEGVPTAGIPGEPPRPAPRVRDHDSPDIQGSQGAQGSPRGSQLQGHSRAPACPLEPGDGSAWPRSDARGQPSQAPAVEGLPSTPGAERDWPDGEHHRRPLHYAKYKAQSFSDQRAFDLSFRPTILRATDTFAPPK